MVHLFHAFPTFAVGGAQRRFALLANHFAARYRHTVTAMDGNMECAARIDRGVGLELLPLPVAKGGGIDLGNVVRFWKILRQQRPEILVTYNWGSIEWSVARLGCPGLRHVHFEDGFGGDETPQRQLRRRVLMRRAVLGSASAVIVPSLSLHRLAVGRWGLPAKRVRYIPNGIDAAAFGDSPDPALADAVRGRAGELVVGTLGILRPEKNFARLIAAVRLLSRSIAVRLVIVGDGPERASLEELARQGDGSPTIVFLGAIDRPVRVLGHFDVFALSSDTEQMPYSVLEAMAARLPVVATDVGDIKQMLPEESRSFVVPVDAGYGLAEALSALLADADRRRRLGECNREHVARVFPFSRMIEEYDSIFSGRPAIAPLHPNLLPRAM